MSENIDNEKKELKIITGDGSELDVSPVYEHLNIAKPKAKSETKKEKLIIPEIKKRKK